MEFDRPNVEKDFYTCLFIHVKDRIYTTQPGDHNTQHDELAVLDGIDQEIRDLRRSDPTSVDAGLMGIDNLTKNIHTGSKSHELHLPVDGVKKQARETTIEVIKTKAPSYDISGTAL